LKPLARVLADAIDNSRNADYGAEREIEWHARCEAALDLVCGHSVRSQGCMDEERFAVARRPGPVFNILDAVDD
jgi:hypothetical protein